MPAERRFGMDHEHYDWSPLSKRGILRWPDGARVALCVIVDLDHPEWQPPEDSFATPFAGGLSARSYPDYARLGHREYGHRVGIFRVLDTLEKHGIKATVAMDAMTAENYPFLVRHCQEQGVEIIGHGVALTRMITSNMSEDVEREYIGQSISAPDPGHGERAGRMAGTGIRRVRPDSPVALRGQASATSATG